MKLNIHINKSLPGLCRLYLIAAALALLSPHPLYGQTVISGNIESMVSGIVNDMPGNGSNAFVIPSNQQLSAFETILSDLKAGNFPAVQSKLAPYAYTLFKYIHNPTMDTFYLIRENSPVQRGWGTYIYNPKSTNDFSVEVPHPLWDRYTWDLGIKAFIRSKAKWFLMAGTHRYANTDTSSDMAHVTQSVFHTVHRVAATASALQVHGYDSSNPVYNGYPLVVISNGTLYPPAIHYTLRDNYAAQSFSAGVFSYSTYNQLRQLGATTNEQGKWSNQNGKRFVHVEHDQPLRFNSDNLSKCASIISKTFGLPSSIAENLTAASPFIITAFPNPFNPSTNITASVNHRGDYTVTVYDLLGRVKAVVYRGTLEKGTYRFRFNAENASGGIYLCRIQSGKNVKSIKLLLQK